MARRVRLVLLALTVGLVAAELVLQFGYLATWLLGGRPGSSQVVAPGCSVLCVGDSFTYGMGASAPAMSYPAQLERQLRHGGESWQVINRGWPGRNSRDVLEALDAALATMRPAFVCITVGVNDSWSRPEALQLPERIPDAETQGGSGSPPFVFTLRLWRLIRTFRAPDPFRDQPTRDAAALAGGGPSDVLAGRWRTLAGDFRLRLDVDGTGQLGDQALDWTATAEQLRLQLGRGDVVQAEWRLDQGSLVVKIGEGAVRLVADDGSAAPPREAASEAYRAMAAADWPAGEVAFRAAIEQAAPGDPQLPMLHAGVVRALVPQGRRDEALKELEIVRRFVRDRADPDAKEGLIDALMALGFEGEAAQHLEAAIAAGARARGLWAMYARLLEKRDDLAGARAAIDAAIELARSAGWTGQEFLHRTKARLHRDGAFDVFAEAVVEAHLLDGRFDVTRQTLMYWKGPEQERIAAMQRALARRTLSEPTARRLMATLREAMGVDAEGWQAVLRSHLHQVIRRCRQIGATPLLGAYPFQFEARGSIESLAAEEGVPFVAVDRAFARMQEQEPTLVLRVADGHCNDDGYGLMATEFAKAIAAARSVPK